MIALSHGVPVVTTTGPLTENVWAESGAVRLAPPGDVTQFLNAVNELLSDKQKRIETGMRARQLYLDRFDISHTIQALRRAPKPDLASRESRVGRETKEEGSSL